MSLMRFSRSWLLMIAISVCPMEAKAACDFNPVRAAFLKNYQREFPASLDEAGVLAKLGKSFDGKVTQFSQVTKEPALKKKYADEIASKLKDLGPKIDGENSAIALDRIGLKKYWKQVTGEDWVDEAQTVAKTAEKITLTQGKTEAIKGVQKSLASAEKSIDERYKEVSAAIKKYEAENSAAKWSNDKAVAKEYADTVQEMEKAKLKLSQEIKPRLEAIDRYGTKELDRQSLVNSTAAKWDRWTAVADEEKLQGVARERFINLNTRKYVDALLTEVDSNITKINEAIADETANPGTYSGGAKKLKEIQESLRNSKIFLTERYRILTNALDSLK